jgi:hypothetical protein
MVRSYGRRGGRSGDFQDRDRDGVSELQKDHVDFEGGDARNVGSVDTGGRLLTSQDTRTITVGQDVTTIQEAFDVTARLREHHVEIVIPDDDYPEDPVLTATAGGSLRQSGDTVGVWIHGNSASPKNVTVNSLTTDGVAAWVKVDGIRTTADSPHTDEAAHIECYNTKHVSIQNAEFRSGTNGVVAYNTNVEIGGGVDFGTDSLSGDGVITKHNGVAWTNEAGTAPVGNVGGWAFTAQDGQLIVHTNRDTLTGTSGNYRRSSAGRIYDADTGTQVGGHPSAVGFSQDTLPNLTSHTNNDVSVAASGTKTIFDNTGGGGNVGILGGNIVGYNPTAITVTWEDGTTDTIPAGSRAENGAGDRVSVVPLPAVGPVQKLSFDNGDGGASHLYGWSVWTFGQN